VSDLLESERQVQRDAGGIVGGDTADDAMHVPFTELTQQRRIELLANPASVPLWVDVDAQFD
jgi:hypothetical protein